MTKIYLKELSYQIVGAGLKVHRTLGFGLQEVLYQRALKIELKKRGLLVESEKKFAVFYEGEYIGEYYADLVVEKKVIIETKAVSLLTNKHMGQLLNYLRISTLHLGYLFNFANVKFEFKRFLI